MTQPTPHPRASACAQQRRAEPEQTVTKPSTRRIKLNAVPNCEASTALQYQRLYKTSSPPRTRRSHPTIVPFSTRCASPSTSAPPSSASAPASRSRQRRGRTASSSRPPTHSCQRSASGGGERGGEHDSVTSVTSVTSCDSVSARAGPTMQHRSPTALASPPSRWRARGAGARGAGTRGELRCSSVRE
eukprot:5325552-Prymnesium_polylepis.1